MSYVPDAILIARRKIANISGVHILNDVVFDQNEKQYYIHLKITIDNADNPYVPKESEWYVLIDKNYPDGFIGFYPSKVNGIKHTFPHQDRNDEGKSGQPWRSGKLCLNVSGSHIDRIFKDTEPEYNIKERLAWHVHRAICWLKCASTNQLINVGDPFELPVYPISSNNSNFIFHENEKSIEIWKSLKESIGFVRLTKVKIGERDYYITKSYQKLTGVLVYKPDWGKLIGSEICSSEFTDNEEIGIWINLRNIPVMKPWQVPSTWKELQKTLKDQDVELFDLLEKVIDSLRDGKKHFLLLGFPIPKYWREDTAFRFQWQPLELPLISSRPISVNGFRKASIRNNKKRKAISNKNRYQFALDKLRCFVPLEKLNWLNNVSNWGIYDLTQRGVLEAPITSKKMLIIGCGAIGSLLAEHLVRSAIYNLTLIDSDVLLAGNLVRHNLTLSELGFNKAKALETRLNSISPHAEVTGIAEGCTKEWIRDSIDSFDVIIDCTGSDQVLNLLSDSNSALDKLFFSVSVGFKAKRMFFYCSRDKNFNSCDFRTKINQWIQLEKEETKDLEFPWEGIGCWHPVFPARYDDISLFVSVTVKLIEKALLSPDLKPELKVYQQIFTNEDSDFQGIKQVHLSATKESPNFNEW